MGNNLDILNKLILDKEINRRERDMIIALKAFDFEDSNIISVGLQSLLDYFCIKNKKSIYSVLRTLQAKNYIRIEKKYGKKNIYVIIKDYLLFNNSEESRYADVPSNSQDSYTDVSSYEESGYTDVSTREEGRYADMPSNEQDSYTVAPSYEESSYTDVSTREEGRYADVPSNAQNSYIDVSSYEESGYTDVSTREEGRYVDVTGNEQNRYIDVSSYEESGYTDVSTKEEDRYADVTGNEQSRYIDVSSYEESRYTDVSSDYQGRYDNVSTSHNIYNNIYIINNKIYINIINYWNSKRIGKVVSLNIKIIDSINKAMAKYSFDEIKKAIDNYANVYNSDYFYDFQWHLPYFLTRNNAIGKFVDNGDIWLRYKQKYSMLY